MPVALPPFLKVLASRIGLLVKPEEENAVVSIRPQLHNNAVALISLFVAVSSLAYNTWRNETTEAQRNIRH